MPEDLYLQLRTVHKKHLPNFSVNQTKLIRIFIFLDGVMANKEL
jgi:hypothetical protein